LNMMRKNPRRKENGADEYGTGNMVMPRGKLIATWIKKKKKQVLQVWQETGLTWL